MTWTKVAHPLKPVVIGGLLLGSVFTLTSSDYDKADKNLIHSELNIENTKRLVNTSWKLKYFDCQNCGARPDDLVLQENGKGLLENTPVKWSVKDDSVRIEPEIPSTCNLTNVMLADENLMFGGNHCSGDDRAVSFVASKVAKNESIAVTPTTTNENASANIISIFDKTYMFKRGFEKVYGERRIDAIILHSSFCINSNDPFDLYCVLAEYKRHGVAAHYLIDREGNIHRLVSENNVAFHAGFGKMPDGNNFINRRSLGIELINSEKEGPNELQYNALARLVKDIKSRYRIKYIKGHNHIAPDRKSDPWKFNWKTFHQSIREEEVMP